MRLLHIDPASHLGQFLARLREWFSQSLSRIAYSYELLLDDLPATRAQTARRLLGLAQQFVREPDNVRLLRRIEAAAKNRHRFKRCYALDTLGRLGELAQESIPIQINGLLSDDPFVREAAAQALFRLGKWATPATNELARVLEDHVTEGTARYAVLALGKIGDTSPEILDALRYAASADNSYAAQEAASVYSALSLRPRQI